MRRIFLNSLPKSGTNLAAKALDLMGFHEAEFLHAGKLTHRGFFTWWRRKRWLTEGEHYVLGVSNPQCVKRAPVEALLKRVPDDGYVFAHVGYNSALLDAVLARGFGACVVTRDPRAVLASLVRYVLNQPHHGLHATMKSLGSEERYHLALNGSAKIPLAPLKTRCEAMAPWLESDQVLHLRFEDLVGPEGGGDHARQMEALESLAQLGGCAQVDLAAIRSQLFGPGRHTFSKGQIEGWRDELSPEILAELTHQIGPLMRAWGYR